MLSRHAIIVNRGGGGEGERKSASGLFPMQGGTKVGKDPSESLKGRSRLREHAGPVGNTKSLGGSRRFVFQQQEGKGKERGGGSLPSLDTLGRGLEKGKAAFDLDRFVTSSHR